MSGDGKNGRTWRNPVFINSACGALADGFTKMIRDEGVVAAYRGLTPTVMALLPSWAIYFPVYEHMKRRLAGSPIPEVWQHVLASSTAGAANVFVTNPLWVAKTRLQIQGFHSIPSPDKNSTVPFKYRGTFHALWSIFRHEGLAGVYSGLSPSLVGVSHIAIQVPLYEELKRLSVCSRGGSAGKGDVTTTDIIFSSSLAKMVASSVTYPHEVIRSHMHASGRGGFSAFLPICKQIVKDEGVCGLYRGLGANLLRTTPAAAITFLTYEASRKVLTEWVEENDRGSN